MKSSKDSRTTDAVQTALAVLLAAVLTAAAPQGKTKASSAPKAIESRPLVAEQVISGDTVQGPECYVVLPGGKIELSVAAPEGAGVSNPGGSAPAATDRVFSMARSVEYRWKVPTGIVGWIGDRRLEWAAPAKPGHYQIGCEVESRGALKVAGEGTEGKPRDLAALRASTVFHILVPYEFDPDGPGVIEGVPIGIYPNENDKNVKAIIAEHRDLYRPPRWFVGLTPETRDLRVSAHFRLREFVPEAPKDATVFFPYNANLCRALETVLEDLRTSALPDPHVRILRGYVSPHDAERQRRQGARLLTWNRYQYGDGALIVANRDAGMKMGDLTGDGKADVRDAEFLAQVVLRVQKRLRLPGWIGVYAERPDPTLPETPMVGFDLRGYWAESYSVEP